MFFHKRRLYIRKYNKRCTNDSLHPKSWILSDILYSYRCSISNKLFALTSQCKTFLPIFLNGLLPFLRRKLHFFRVTICSFQTIKLGRIYTTFLHIYFYIIIAIDYWNKKKIKNISDSLTSFIIIIVEWYYN